MISIRRIDEYDNWGIGYFMHPQFQNQGYTKEACAEIISFGFTCLGAGKIEAQHAVWNESSGRVLQSAGMEFLEFLPRGFMKNGDWVEENRYAITHEQWKKRAVSGLSL